MDNYILRYYQEIKNGTTAAGRWVIAVYTFIVKGLEDRLFFYNPKKAERAIWFIENFAHHSKGKLAPGLLKLELWQKAMLSCIFGIVKENGTRQFREVFIVIGRKCGKSILACAIAEYMAYADGEYGADIFFLAPKLDQTDIVYNDFWQSVEKEPELLAITKSRKTDVYIAETNTQIKKIAFSQKKSDGFNPHCTVCDEVAAWQGDAGIKQYEVMTSALGSREQPLVLAITTENYINDGIYDDLMKRSTRVLMGDSRELQLLPFIYQIDDLKKWNDISELRKSLPGLGVSVSVDFMLNEIAKAEGSLAAKSEFMCKYCDIKQSSSQAWLKSEDIDRAFSGECLKLEDFTKCYGGTSRKATASPPTALSA